MHRSHPPESAALKTLWLLATLVVIALPARASAAAPQVQVYVAAGNLDSVTVRGRVSRPGAAKLVPRAPGRRDALTDNVGVFLTDELEDYPVRVLLQGHAVETRTDDDGYFSAVFKPEGGLTPGVHPVRVSAAGQEGVRGEGRAIIAPRGPGRTVVSDFDDTLAVSGVRSRRALLTNVFAKGPEHLQPVPGMAAFLRCLEAGREGQEPERALVHYLSASPNNLYDKITRYLDLRRFPLGPVHLRDVDLSNLSDSRPHKVQTLLAIAAAFPEHRLVLVGDSGEADPEVYREIAGTLGDRVEAVFIHRVGAGEDLSPERFESQQLVADGFQALTEAVRLGLVHPACAEAAEAAIDPRPASQ